MTWISGSSYQNPVDACVLVNVAALLTLLNLQQHSVYAAIRYCLDKLPVEHYPWRQLAPYYAQPAELQFALRRAIRLGATELQPLLERFHCPPAEEVDDEQAVCCNDTGLPLWYAPVLQQTRRLFSTSKMKMNYG